MKRILSLLCAAMMTACSAEAVPSAQTAPSSGDPDGDVTSAEQTVQETEYVPEVKTVTYTAVGDNLIHSTIYNQAHERAEGKEYVDYDFEYAYEGVADLLDKADISVINQETVISDINPPSDYPLFNSPPDLGNHMVRLGFDVFGIANNHILDQKSEGLEASLDYYDRKGLVRVGAYHNEEDRNTLRIVEKNGVKTSFLAYTEYTNGLSLPADSPLCYGSIAEEEDIEKALEEVKAASKKADVVIVMLHWGVEDSDEVTEYQRTLAQRFADAGTTMILGSHPHVLRDIEPFTAADGHQMVCVYSLGNFISAQDRARNLISGVYNFSINVTDGKTEIGYTEFIPIVTHYDWGFKNLRLYKLSDYTRELAEEHGVNKYDDMSLDMIYDYLEKHNLYRRIDEE
ncbi:MAG: CapA family protein [Oscillospiraceae bacterium]|nr:CapA family protein [Oscillospiraceae bacterium]